MQTHAVITVNRGAPARSYLRGVEFFGGYAAISGAWAGLLDSWLLAVMGGLWLLTSGLMAALLPWATASRKAAPLPEGYVAPE